MRFTVFVVAACVLLFLAAVDVKGQCTNSTVMQAAQQACIDKEGLNIRLPSSSDMASKDSLLNFLTSDQYNLTYMCSHKDKFERMASCVTKVTRACMPDGFDDYTTTASQVNAMNSEMCAHQNDINQTCIAQQTSALYDCAQNAQNGTQLLPDAKEMICQIFAISLQCQRKLMPACGNTTSNLMIRWTSKYMTPRGCQGAAPACLSSVGLLALAALLAHLLSL